MLHLRRALLLGLTTLSLGCGSTIIIASPPDTDAGFGADVSVIVDPPRDASVIVDPPRDASVIIGDDNPAPTRTCRGAVDCPAGSECVGPQGCGVPWTCQPRSRMCTDDLQVFCGCDGTLFRGSSTCPPRPYAFVGTCDDPPPPVDAGPVMPAGCTLPDGRFCPFGETCRVSDGCTVCRCGPRGLECSTSSACGDAGTRRDVGVGSCTARGVTCPVGSTCRVPPFYTCFCAAPERFECTADPDPMPDASVPPPIDGGSPVFDAGVVDVGTVDGPLVEDVGNLCASQDAHGEGLCDAFLGVHWVSNRCVGVSGCRCVGADCGNSYASFTVCEEVHLPCRR